MSNQICFVTLDIGVIFIGFIFLIHFLINVQFKQTKKSRCERPEIALEFYGYDTCLFSEKLEYFSTRKPSAPNYVKVLNSVQSLLEFEQSYHNIILGKSYSIDGRLKYNNFFSSVLRSKKGYWISRRRN